MPESTLTALELAEQSVARGDLKQALDRLQPAVRHHAELNRDAVTLRSRLHMLDRQVNLGVIDREDESLERSRILQGILDLIETAKGPANTTDLTVPPGTLTPWRRRRWVYGLIGLGLLIVLAWGLRTLSPISSSTPRATSYVFELLLELRTPSAGSPAITGGGIAASLGELALPLKSWRPDRVLTYPAVDAAHRDDSLRIELTGWPYRYTVRKREDRLSGTTRRIVLVLQPETETFAGVLTTPRGEPVAGAELVFDGRFRAETDDRGRYEIELPLSKDGVVRLEIRRDGKVLEAERKIGQRASILAAFEVSLPPALER